MTSSTRPPSILSPHGEGYCRHCRFVLGLNEQGLMDVHWYNRGQSTETKPCKGSLRRPATVTPYFSRLSVFKAVPQYAACPVCRDPHVLLQYGDLFSRHNPPRNAYEFCKGSFSRYVRPTR